MDGCVIVERLAANAATNRAVVLGVATYATTDWAIGLWVTTDATTDWAVSLRKAANTTTYGTRKGNLVCHLNLQWVERMSGF
jgi:hypothetical protein